MPITPGVQFFDATGRHNVRPDLNALMSCATSSLRAAVCFFTGPGLQLLKPHVTALSRTGSFFVASVDWPTNLDALLELHHLAPGHIFIHLGGITPKEKGGGRALMHSKLIAAVGEDECALWVGSHNFTAQAITGGNMEAGIRVDASLSFQQIEGALKHLEACRATAELFDPTQMGRAQR